MKVTTILTAALFAQASASWCQSTAGVFDAQVSSSLSGSELPIHTVLLDPPVDVTASTGGNTPSGFRVGANRKLNVDFMQAAEWSLTPNDRMIGRLALKSPEATTMSLLFSSFHLSGEAQLFVYDRLVRTKHSFSAATRTGTSGQLQTPLVPGAEIIVEFQGSTEERNNSSLAIGSYMHGLLDLFHLADDERGGGCLIDVACSLGDGWLDQRRSVVLFLKDDGYACTGVILNNTDEDFTPYVQIANHCIAGNPSNWIFYFNYENPGCSSGSAPLSQSLTGATFRSSDYNGDFALYELDDPIPVGYHAYYAGWDRTNTTPSNGVFIGHPVESDFPSLDAEKKIGAYSGATSGNIGFSVPGWIVDIDQGGVLGGSSGSPLFNASKRLVGHISNGDTDCIDAWIHAPKVYENWDGPSANTRLKDWLDPGNSAVNTSNGIYDDLRIKVKAFLQGPYSGGTMSTGLTDNSYTPTTEPYTGVGYTHVLTGGGETTTSGVLTASGNAKIVDWVVIELRQPSSPYAVIATRSALLRKDGTVAETDGSTNGILFRGLPTSTVRVAVRHRNHLGTMSSSSFDLATFTGTVDFSTTSTSLYGTDPTYVTGSVRNLWIADVTRNSQLKYTGSGNDRDPILARVGSGTPNNVVYGYYPEDTTLDGAVKYTGSGNDRDPILTNLPGGGSNPNAVRNAQLP